MSLECPHCHEDCDTIYKCENCDALFCEHCAKEDNLRGKMMMADYVLGKLCPCCDEGRGTKFTSDDNDD